MKLCLEQRVGNCPEEILVPPWESVSRSSGTVKAAWALSKMAIVFVGFDFGDFETGFF